MKTVTCPLAMAFLLFSSQARSDDPGAVRDAIKRGNAQYIQAFKNADAAGVASVYAIDGNRFHAKGGISRGRAAIQRDLEGFIKKTGPVTVTIKTLDLWIVEDRAYETGQWSYTFQPAGKDKTTMAGNYVTIWQRQKDGGWKIIADMDVPRE